MKKKPEEPEEKIVVWVTKYALSKGVFTRKVVVCGEISERMVKVVKQGPSEFYHGKEWHRTEAEALAQVEKMVAAKRASLAKGLNKLDKVSALLSEGKLPMSRADGAV